VGGESMIGQACARREPVIAQDVSEAKARYINPLLPNTRAEMALPLIVGDQVLGAMTIQADRPHVFSPEDLTVLNIVADSLAVALQNARTLEALQRLAHEERIMNEFVAHVMRFGTVWGRLQAGLEIIARLTGASSLAVWVGRKPAADQDGET